MYAFAAENVQIKINNEAPTNENNQRINSIRKQEENVLLRNNL